MLYLILLCMLVQPTTCTQSWCLLFWITLLHHCPGLAVVCECYVIIIPTFIHVLVQDQPNTAAPSATTYELEVSKASTSSSSWADAALAGLPPDDEAVQMAELAATAGRSIEVSIVA